jgi:hypothetical protein
MQTNDHKVRDYSAVLEAGYGAHGTPERAKFDEEAYVFYTRQISLMSRGIIKIVLLSFLLIGSQLLNSQSTTNALPVIDVSKNHPRKEFYLQDIAKVEYIPFETNDNALMGRTIKIFYVSDDYIIAANVVEGDVFVYDGKGKWKYSFNHKGQGPREYLYLRSIAFDAKAKELFVCEWSSNSKILVYAENGTYKRTLPCPSNFWPNLYNYDDETLFVYDEYGIFDMKGYSSKPYRFMSKKDGSITDSLNIHLPVRLSNFSVWEGEQDGQPMIFSRYMGISYNRSYGKNFLIADWSADTIYKLTPQKELQPMLVRTPPMQSTNPKILLSNFLVTDKFILLGAHGMDYDALRNGQEIDQKQLMYDFRTGETHVYRLKNKDIASSTNVMIMDAITPENTGITLYNPAFLYDLNDKNDLQGDLKELLKTLDEEDNPVLVKIKF